MLCVLCGHGACRWVTDYVMTWARQVKHEGKVESKLSSSLISQAARGWQQAEPGSSQRESAADDLCLRTSEVEAPLRGHGPVQYCTCTPRCASRYLLVCK